MSKVKINIKDNITFVTFKFDRKIIEIIRDIPFRKYNALNHSWIIPNNMVEKFINVIGKENVFIIGEIPKALNILPNDFKYVTKPFQHQIEGVNYGLKHKNWLLGDDQGLGKTKQVIDIAVAKKDLYGYKHCLIICAVNNLKWNWEEEIKVHSKEDSLIIGALKKGKTGSSNFKCQQLSHLNKIKQYFIIINIESLRNSQIVSILQDCIRYKLINMIVVDEIHRCKNPTSQQSKGLLKLNSEEKIGMSGTPLLDSPFDLFTIFKWLGYETHSFYQFKHHYANFGGFGGYEVTNYKNLNELSAMLDTIMLRRKKEDVLDLPEKLHKVEYIEMNKKQEEIYNEIRTELIFNIDKIKNSNNPLAMFTRLRQATGYTGILSTKIKESAKFVRMAEIVEDAVKEGDKVIIFSNWTSITNPVKELLKKYNPAYITGETKNVPTQKDKFMKNDSCKVIIGTIGAMGTGLTLTAGNTVIFLDEPWNRGIKDQAEDRAHRIGTKGTVNVVTLVCKNTIDERINELVYNKGEISDFIIDKKIGQNKNATIKYLLDLED